MTAPHDGLASIAIVGASLAGVQAAQALRRQEYEGSIVMIGDEPHYPYDRPPLSKDFLAGPFDVDKLRLRPTADPEALGLDWRLGRAAVGLEPRDRGGGTVILDDDSRVDADGVLIATGARARSLPGADGLSGVHLLRTLDDAEAIRADLDAGLGPMVVIGCGFIGAEVAATARERGAEVTIVEAAPAPMTRVLDAASGMAIADLHRSHGVEVRLGVGVDRLTSDGGRVAGVALADGTVVDAAIVVVGIGVVPNTGWLDGSGLRIDDGVVTDETCLAAPGIVAAGDVARWPHGRRGGALTRIEQWDNAVEMGTYAAGRLLSWAAGETAGPYNPVPWFWSDQYDRKIQLAGVAGPSTELVQGSLDEQMFVQLYHDDGEVCGALCWNRPRQAIMARQLIAAGTPLAEMREQLS